MKRLTAVVVLCLFLAGCSGQNAQMDRVLAFRSELLKGKGCSFEAVITADYGKESYIFTLECTADEKGSVSFSVKEPDGISGITGTVSNQGGKLTFEDKALAFELLADGQFSPVSSPWVLVKTLRSGFITACGHQGEYLLVSMDDSYADDALHLDIWLDKGDTPVRAEILWNDRRCLSMEVKNFRIL